MMKTVTVSSISDESEVEHPKVYLKQINYAKLRKRRRKRERREQSENKIDKVKKNETINSQARQQSL